jgi:DNA-binding transcriptional MerR regulator
MRIEDVARELKVSRDWLRRKEREGLFPAITRDRVGHRRYSAADLEAIRRVVYHQPVALDLEQQKGLLVCGSVASESVEENAR